jgi:hypothetical protein
VPTAQCSMVSYAAGRAKPGGQLICAGGFLGDPTRRLAPGKDALRDKAVNDFSTTPLSEHGMTGKGTPGAMTG